MDKPDIIFPSNVAIFNNTKETSGNQPVGVDRDVHVDMWEDDTGSMKI